VRGRGLAASPYTAGVPASLVFPPRAVDSGAFRPHDKRLGGIAWHCRRPDLSSEGSIDISVLPGYVAGLTHDPAALQLVLSTRPTFIKTKVLRDRAVHSGKRNRFVMAYVLLRLRVVPSVVRVPTTMAGGYLLRADVRRSTQWPRIPMDLSFCRKTHQHLHLIVHLFKFVGVNVFS
jgi:hypothetical protein